MLPSCVDRSDQCSTMCKACEVNFCATVYNCQFHRARHSVKVLRYCCKTIIIALHKSE